MLLHSRFVVVDDREVHLNGIKEALDYLRLDCHTKHYDEERVAEWKPMPGVRMLFIDKNLQSGITIGSSSSSVFASIVDVIEKIISPESGPYGLVLWAEDPDLDGLKAFINERIENPRLRPVFCTQMRKADYINTSNGTVHDHTKLKDDLIACIGANPQMKALFSWEADVSAAVDAVLRSVVDLVPPGKCGTDQFGSELGRVLYRLSQAGAGADKAMENPREAINRVLVPILSDRILDHDPQDGSGMDWKTALVEPEDKKSTLVRQAVVNTAIHLSTEKHRNAKSTPIKPTDLGAVVEFPFNPLEKALIEIFGVSEKELRGGIFRAKKAEWDDCKLRLVQIGAACDHAQPKPGPLLYLLGIEWSFSKDDGSFDEAKPTMCLGDKGTFGRDRAVLGIEWQSPVLNFPEMENPGKLSVYKNLSMSIPSKRAQDWKPAYRFRDELISELTQEYARFISRPGIVKMP